jgi:frataxin
MNRFNLLKLNKLIHQNIKFNHRTFLSINLNGRIKIVKYDLNFQPSFKKLHDKGFGDDSNKFSKNKFQDIANETLESLTDRFDSLADEYSNLFTDEFDVTYSNNVLTIKLDSKRGTFVLNTQTPNSQIWLSSPKSGPYRYDFIDNKWVYKHTGETLHELLTKEFSELYNKKIDFSKCSYSGTNG